MSDRERPGAALAEASALAAFWTAEDGLVALGTNVRLSSPLPVHWSGNAKELSDALTSHGLATSLADSPGGTVLVFPAGG